MAGNLELAIKITADGKAAVIDLEKIGVAAGQMKSGLEAAGKVKPLDQRAVEAATTAVVKSNTETARAAGNALLLERAQSSLNAQLARGQISQTQHAAALQTLNTQYGRASEGSDRLGGSIGRVVHYAAGLVVLNQVVGYAKQALDMAEGYKQIEARLKLATSTSAEFAAAQASVFRIASTVGAPLAETATLYTRMAPVLKEVGYEQRQVSDLAEIVAKSLRLSGAGAAESASTMLQFAQAMGSGVLRGDEFNSLMENSPVLMRNLAKGMDVPIGQLRKMAEEGELSSKKVAESLLKMKDQIDKDFSQLPVSVSQAWQRLANAVQIGIGEMDKASETTAVLARGLEFVRENLDSVAKAGALIGAGLAFLGTAAALTTPVGAAIGVVTISAVALAAGFKLLAADQKKLAADTAKTDEVMGELNKAIVKLSAERADPGIIEGIKRVREAAASGAISIDQAAEALGKFIALKEGTQGKGVAAETFFKEFVFDQKKFDRQLKEIEDHASAARARGTFNQAAYERAVNKLIEDANKQKQEMYNADAQARLKAMVPPTEAVRQALQRLDDEYKSARASGLADEVKYQQDRAKIIQTALADGASKVAETKQRIAQEDRRRIVGEEAFQIELIRQRYEAEIAASYQVTDGSRVRGDIEMRIESDIADLRKKLQAEFVTGDKAAKDEVLANANALADGEASAANRAATAWAGANAKAAGGKGGTYVGNAVGALNNFTTSDGSRKLTVQEAMSVLNGYGRYAAGGPIAGPGSGTSDSILARVSNGEYVVRAAAVERYGSGFMSAINNMSLPRFAAGGAVGGGDRAAAGGNSYHFNMPNVTNASTARKLLKEAAQILRTEPNILSPGFARAG